MKKRVCEISYGEKRINCEITYKRMRTITFRLSRDGSTLRVSAPIGIKEEYLKSKIQEVFPKLYARSIYEKPIEGDDVYIFGEKRHIDGFSSLSNDKRKALLRSYLLPYCEKKANEYGSIMGVDTPYSIKVRDMSSRYGVNNRTKHTLTFALSLLHYSPDIIDSVIVHELAHHFVFDHSRAFYETVYRYYPSYKENHGKLRKHVYK